MSQLVISIIVGIVDVVFCLFCILFFIYSHKLGKLSEINAKLKRANKLCEYAQNRVDLLDKRIYSQERILQHRKQVEELAKAVATEIKKNQVKEKADD